MATSAATARARLAPPSGDTGESGLRDRDEDVLASTPPPELIARFE